MSFCINKRRFMSGFLSKLCSIVLATILAHLPVIKAHGKTNLRRKFCVLAATAPNIDNKVLHYALNAYNKAQNLGVVKKHILTVIDYSKPSNKKRMWVFNVDNNKLMYNTFVAHGKNSGIRIPHVFSNQISSKETSLGTYITTTTYSGHKGYSLHLNGLEKGLNNNAFTRHIVMHGAWYVEPKYIKKSGRAGRSWGCPAIAASLAKPIINFIKSGTVLFAYSPDKFFLSHSAYIAA